ncbi:hypothetical protein E7T06_04975 [Deinococcus sp. Arct2-2]|uniref:tetratricopeptide repeat protein n=1 Tax=Deinococcus sp. Arct2-2 TaxID=2568653 RepID=UPI0010A3AA64|nr:tetratricopeptide repeat protein [Deinococcus sp. Arct2-2]THF70915.1 hypothetical protein E7T06_04975 [Deinococcus sp. Arct2-2]
MTFFHKSPWAALACALLLSTASAQTQPWRAWSDALPRPALEEAQDKVAELQATACGESGNAGALLAQLENHLGNASPLSPQALQAALDSAGLQPPAQRPVALSLSSALAHAQAWLEQHDPAGLKALAASEDARSAAKAKAAALEATLLNKPNAAAAALLTAHRLDPKDAETLVNLGGALVVLALPNEALAVLDAANQLPLPIGGALGWSPQAVALNNRGVALLDLGQAGSAEPLFRQALRLTPDLVEARSNLARALACTGKTAEAATLLRASGRRTAQPTPATPGTPVTPTGVPPAEVTSDDDPEGTEETTRPIEWAFDISHGKGVNLPNLKLPGSPKEALELNASYGALSTTLVGRVHGLAQQQSQLISSLGAQRLGEPPLVQLRQAALDAALVQSRREPRIRSLWTATEQADREVQRVIDGFNQEFSGFYAQTAGQVDALPRLQALCIPAMSSATNSWRAAMNLYATRLAKAAEAQYRLETGLAANSSDSQWHLFASLTAEHTAVNSYATLVNSAAQWTGLVTTLATVCVESETTSLVQEVAGPLHTPRADLCSGTMDHLSLSVSIKVVQISVSCDKASLKVASPGWIGAFGKVDKSFTSGDVTVSAGAEIGAEVPLTSAGIKAAGGFYVTLNAEGEFKDVGVLAEAKASLSTKVGPVKIGSSVKGLSGRWSLIAGSSH